MRFSQLVALVLVFGLTLSFDVSAKPSWKDTSSTTEKPGGKKNRDTSTDPTITQWDFAELTSGTWEFSIASIDTQGIYSSYSSVTSKIIN